VRYCLNKNQRLLKKSSFQKVIASNQKLCGTYIRVFYLLSPLKEPKIGLTTPSNFGNAAQRNLFKRRMREIFRRQQREINRSLEIIIYPLKPAKNCSYLELEDEFLSLLKKI
jgi:ribonuclease P protein component